MKLEEDKNESHLNNLNEIRQLMERSSRFSLVSGITLITAGIIAIFGALYAAFQLNFPIYAQAKNIMSWSNTPEEKITLKFLFTVAIIVIVLALLQFLFFAAQKAKKHNVKFLDHTGRIFIFNHALFLLTGGFFAVVLFYYGVYFLMVPTLLIFYGLALINISKFTFNAIRNLGIIEVILGAVLCLMPVYSFLFFFIGFGVMHIVYGLILHFKYDTQGQ